MQGSVTCFAMAAPSMKGATILEVGCGSGVGSLIYASAFLNGGSVLVSTDFSAGMIKLLKKRYEESDCARESYQVDTESDYTQPGSKVNLKGIIASKGDFKKFVYSCQASGTHLPFENNSFTGYVASLVL